MDEGQEKGISNSVGRTLAPSLALHTKEGHYTKDAGIQKLERQDSFLPCSPQKELPCPHLHQPRETT